MKYVCTLVVALALATSGCGACISEATRCHGQEAQVCDSRGHWRTVMDCDDVQGDSPFTCGEEDGDHTCLPDTMEGGAE